MRDLNYPGINGRLNAAKESLEAVGNGLVRWVCLYFTKLAAVWTQNGTRLSYMFAAVVFTI